MLRTDHCDALEKEVFFFLQAVPVVPPCSRQPNIGCVSQQVKGIRGQ